MFNWIGKARTIRGGAALVMAALAGLVTLPLKAQAGPFPMIAPAQPIVELTWHGLSYAGTIGDDVLQMANGAATHIDSSIKTASTLRPASPLGSKKGARSAGVFGSVAIPFRRLPALEKIAAARQEMAQTSLLLCGTEGCPPSHRGTMTSLAKLQNGSLIEKANAVNRQVNAHIVYKRDAENYGVVDYWATPQEILDRRSGDCEDYAILKMALLRELGVAESDMAIVVLRDETKNLFHAVLALRTNTGHLILDNMRDVILADSALPHYLPLYSVSGGRGFIHGRKSGSGPMRVTSISFDKVAPGEGPVAVHQFSGN